MANEKFKVKFGLAVGDTVATVDGTTGNIVTQGTIDVQGGTVTDSTGALSITTGASNGNITLDPNGTGNVVMTFANGGNLTNDRNYLSGIIRQTAAAAAGDVWGFGPTGTAVPYRGISIDNTASATTTTGKRTGMVMRNYATNPRNSIIGEASRGTNPSAPVILNNGQVMLEMTAAGYAATSDGTGFQATGCTISGTTLTVGTVTSGAPAVGQLLTSVTQGAVVTAGTTITANISGSGSGSTWTVSTSQTVASSTIWGGGDGWMASNNGLAGAIRLVSSENWTNQTSGTNFVVALSPVANASTLALAGATYNVVTMNSNSSNIAIDNQIFRTKPTAFGGTNKVMLQLTEATSTVTTDNFNVNNATTGQQCVTVNTSGGDVVLSVQQQRAATSNDNALVNFSTFRWDGTQYTPTLLQDTIGEFKFNGNVFTGASPGTTTGPGASINAFATENWSPTATGTGFRFNAVRTGTLNSYDVISGNTNSLAFNSDTLNFNSFDSTTNRVSIDGSTASFNVPIKLNNNVIQASDGATAITTVPITSNNPNTDFTGNIVKGQIRAGAGEANGNIYEFTGSAVPSTGISIDNTDKVADRTSLVMRNYGASLSGALPRNTIIAESARGTAASPLNLTNGNSILDIQATGYTSTGFVSDLSTGVPALVRVVTTEAWNNALNNTGAGFQLLLQPTATALTGTGSSLVPVIVANPQSFNSRSDSYTWNKGKTNSSGMMALSDNSGKIQLTVQQPRATSAADYATASWNTYRSTDGVNYTPTQNGDAIGEFKFNGNANTSTTPGVPGSPGGNVTVIATENWTSTANGTQMAFFAIKQGTLTSYPVITANPNYSVFQADNFQFKSAAASPSIYATFDGQSATFNQPVGFPVYTAAAAGAITGQVGWQICISDSAGGGNPNGMMAFWDTTNSRWSYIHDNSAV